MRACYLQLSYWHDTPRRQSYQTSKSIWRTKNAPRTQSPAQQEQEHVSAGGGGEQPKVDAVAGDPEERCYHEVHADVDGVVYNDVVATQHRHHFLE